MSNLSSEIFMSEKQLLSELVHGKFYFASVSRFFLRNTPNTLYITADDSDYPHIQSYFGPPSISDVHKYCEAMNHILSSSDKKIVHWSAYMNLEKFTNAVFLVGTYLLLSQERSPEEVNAITKSIGRGRLLPFRDTTNLPGESTLDMKYFFYALRKSTQLNWFRLDTFNVKEYDRLSSFEGGDMNWIVPGKFLALSCPFMLIKEEYLYIRYFKRHNVLAVIQLNAEAYDREIFRRRGIQHYDLHFPDGTAPNRAITKRFLAVAECTPGAIAVHCRAGLGRTGTLIGAYIIKNYPLTALETTAWIRLCRPGSVIGLQQRFLQANEAWLKNYRFQCNEQLISDVPLAW